MRFLILSDIHSNYQALEAALFHATGTYDQIVCLGDLVGYGADPNRVIDWARQNVPTIVRGNHDRACSGDEVIEWFNGAAQLAAVWTLMNLELENLRYLQRLPQGPAAVANFFAVHGSPADEDEYITDKHDASVAFRYTPGEICFFGHTHHQIGYAMRGSRSWLLVPPIDEEWERAYQLEADTAYLLNPGSIGQPRDADPRAGYALYDSETRVVTFRRAAYDIAAAQERIRNANLPEFLADRLSVGR